MESTCGAQEFSRCLHAAALVHPPRTPGELSQEAPAGDIALCPDYASATLNPATSAGPRELDRRRPDERITGAGNAAIPERWWV
ncbi:hypothetical protein GT204_26890 [Streptomyces sp. SID4919]|uniref:hypothetical protein n=1 Tax=unclassified Streptomyces TaxID=2593676 RepID=UPI000823836D|nr:MULTISPECIES: hypothetical protein [unclassified Streptomyces]MYY12435.1 hypothetical protein [Streptomyces sp. SID4919]SCK54583.1 hypothetical protein YW7DRAFT_05020 [Streptomyces sp. AmelKG-E11A]